MDELIKKHLYNDLSKRDIKEIFLSEYPDTSKEEFDILYSNAFTNL